MIVFTHCFLCRREITWQMIPISPSSCCTAVTATLSNSSPWSRDLIRAHRKIFFHWERARWKPHTILSRSTHEHATCGFLFPLLTRTLMPRWHDDKSSSSIYLHDSWAPNWSSSPSSSALPGVTLSFDPSIPAAWHTPCMDNHYRHSLHHSQTYALHPSTLPPPSLAVSCFFVLWASAVRR